MNTNTESNENKNTPSSAQLSVLLISLLKGIIYQDNDPVRWHQLFSLQTRVRDYVAVLGLELILDESEGYAFLRSVQDEGDETETTSDKQNIPRLIVRRPLSFPVSLLLALLRKKLAESDAGVGETRLILSRDDIIELLRVFLPESSNEAKLVDQMDRHINKVIDLGFLRRLKQDRPRQTAHYEVRRILKAFVDAQWLADFDQQLERYEQHLIEKNDES